MDILHERNNFTIIAYFSIMGSKIYLLFPKTKNTYFSLSKAHMVCVFTNIYFVLIQKYKDKHFGNSRKGRGGRTRSRKNSNFCNGIVSPGTHVMNTPKALIWKKMLSAQDESQNKNVNTDLEEP